MTARKRGQVETIECSVTPITGRLVHPPNKPLVYCAGPMRGIEDFNFPAFDQARDYLNGLGGYWVISPADVDREEGLELEDVDHVPDNIFELCMRRDLEVVTHAHAILLLPGWEGSLGANNELFVANACGAEVWIAQYDEEGNLIGHQVVEGKLTPPMVQTEPESRESILEEAEFLINGPRQASYSHPSDDFTRQAKMWEVILGIDPERGEVCTHIEPHQIGLCMIAVKLCREVHKHKRDSLVDIAGYAGTVQMVHERYEA